MKKTIKSVVAVLLIAVFVSGCSSTFKAMGAKSIDMPEEVLAKVKVQEDPFKKTKTIYFAPIKYGQVTLGEKKKYIPNYDKGYLDQETLTYFMRILIDAKGNKTYQIYGTFNEANWLFLDRAYDSDGNKLDFVKVDQEIVKGIYEVFNTNEVVRTKEDFAINITEKYLRDHLESGIVIKAEGTKGHKYFHVAPFYIEAVLQYIDENKI